jgi:hypothetical protein
MKVGLLLVTLALAVLISITMWAIDVVPFNAWTFSLHVISIYIGVAGVLVYQRRTEK